MRFKKTILLSSFNKGKVKEIAGLVGSSFNVISLNDLKSVPDEYEEKMDTFRGNSEGKALYYHRLTGLPTIADDSGLVVEALGGMPGVLSSRWAGQDADDETRCKKLLAEMKDILEGKRQAEFVCSASFAEGGRIVATFEEKVEGIITTSMRGDHGFGYDPVFFHEGIGKTFAQIDTAEKNRLSHRGLAFRKMANFLRERFSVN